MGDAELRIETVDEERGTSTDGDASRFGVVGEDRMKAVMESPHEHEISPQGPDGTEAKRDAVLRELERVLASRFFRNAMRSKQFLEYVVRHRLDGQTEQLKERTIGTEVFQRPTGYATGDDPVVRVQAGEVRRRLEQYYQAVTEDSQIRIELPVGSYSPVFQWGPAPVHTEIAPQPIPKTELPPPAEKRRWIPWVFVALGLILAVAGTIVALNYHRPVHKSVLDQFWSPIFSTRQPVLICLAKSVAYRPVESVYRRYARTHPGTFQTEAERSNTPLPLDPDEQLTWGDFFMYADYGVAAGDVQAAVALSVLLGRIDKPMQLRIGSNYTYEDLRNSPAVVVGGFNNRWTMQLTSNLHFAFIEDHEKYMIREQGPNGKIWRTLRDDNDQTLEDYGIVSRQFDSGTGQFTVAVAGVGPMGTQAAGEFVSNGQYLEEGLRQAPANWEKGNLEIVLRTKVTDSVSGPPQVVAAYYW
jgi:hypothetical protein